MRRAAVLVALALAGCASAPAVREGAPLSSPALVQLVDWRASGRMAVQTESGGFSANFDWRERSGHGEISVSGPFGAGATHISRSDQRIRIDTGRGPPVEVVAPFTDLDPVLTAQLGAPLPLDTLRFWMLGVPAPGLPSDTVSAGFTQSGWTVHPEQPVTVAGAPAALPHRVTLERDSTRIKVVVDAWTVGS
jgi:outer membrane lipoprotein LolB